MFLQKKCDNNNSISIDTEKRKSNSNNIKLFPLRPNYLRKNESKENKEQYILKSFSNNKGSKNNENSYFPIASSCPLGLKCPFYKKYCKLKKWQHRKKKQKKVYYFQFFYLSHCSSCILSRGNPHTTLGNFTSQNRENHF